MWGKGFGRYGWPRGTVRLADRHPRPTALPQGCCAPFRYSIDTVVPERSNYADMRRLLSPVSVPLIVVILILTVPFVAVGGLFLWSALGDVPFINVQFLPGDGSPTSPTSTGQASPAEYDPSVPEGFTVEVLAEGFANPTAIAVAAGNKLFVAEKGGTVWVLEDGRRLPGPFIDLSPEVNDAGERGLLGMAIDPNFEENGWVYLAFTVDPVFGAPDEQAEVVTYGRLVRYRASEESGRTIADPSSRQILIGESAQDGIPVGSASHTVGDVVFGQDGFLFLSAGEGAHFDFADYGQDIGEFDPSFESTFGAAQDIGAFRAQSLDSLAGKILRLDPATGDGLPTNPFFTGDPKEAASKVWALGFRNPFRFTIRPGTAGNEILYVADVGWAEWEEINAISAGQNGGWPCFEGGVIQPSYWSQSEARRRCEELDPEDVVTPVLSYNRSAQGGGFSGNTVIGGFFYDGPSQPEWDGRYFFADYTEGFIRALRLDGNDRVLEARLFAEELEFPVDLAEGNSGEIYVVEIASGRIIKVTPEGV